MFSQCEDHGHFWHETSIGLYCVFCGSYILLSDLLPGVHRLPPEAGKRFLAKEEERRANTARHLATQGEKAAIRCYDCDKMVAGGNAYNPCDFCDRR